MKNTKGEAAIKKVAQKNGVTVEHVRSEMKKAILEGYMNPETREKWTELFGEGRLPEPEEFILVMSKQVKK